MSLLPEANPSEPVAEPEIVPVETGLVSESLAEQSTVEGFSILRHRGHWRDALRRRMLGIADLTTALIALGFAVWAGAMPLWAVALATLWVVLAKLYGLYDNDHRALRHLTVDELPTLLTWTATSSALSALLVTIIEPGPHSTDAALRVAIASACLAPVTRAAARILWRSLVPPEAAVLVGSGPLELATRRKLELFKDIHVDCVGSLADAERGDSIDRRLAAYIEQLARAGTRPDRVIVATSAVGEGLIAAVVRLCRQKRLKLSVVPPARGMFGTAVQLRHIADLPMIEFSTWDVSRSTMTLKRIIDVTFSTVTLVVTAPLMALVALAIKLDSRGPIFFVQLRAGLGGRAFRMYKFRTMTADAEARLNEVIDVDELADPMFKLRRDPRLTRLGRVLRRTSIDELPQLLNVLRGEMSVVGPRPEQLALVDRYEAEHRFRVAVKPGLTGPMQVYGRGELRFDERLAVEREYIENLSIRRDLRIMLLTVAAVIRGGGAF